MQKIVKNGIIDSNQHNAGIRGIAHLTLVVIKYYKARIKLQASLIFLLLEDGLFHNFYAHPIVHLYIKHHQHYVKSFAP